MSGFLKEWFLDAPSVAEDHYHTVLPPGGISRVTSHINDLLISGKPESDVIPTASPEKGGEGG